MLEIAQYQKDFQEFLESKIWVREPKNLYEPIDYIIALGGKRIRPILTLLVSDVFSGSSKPALNAALAVEVFHNFTLIHDDIMDDAPIRRGMKTVHEKWNVNTGILSGDAMLILAYQFFEAYPPHIFQKLAKLFSKTALEVCDGQQLDIDFETRTDVKIEDYIEMIRLKTSVLVAAALQMGAIVSESSEEDAQHIYSYGLNLGLAFQLQDDFLDTFGDTETFGKQIGGDIIENKKTYLYLKTLELASESDKQKIKHFYSKKLDDNTFKILEVKRIFDKYDIPFHVQKLIKFYTDKAFESIEGLTISEEKSQLFKSFGNYLMSRNK